MKIGFQNGVQLQSLRGPILRAIRGAENLKMTSCHLSPASTLIALAILPYGFLYEHFISEFSTIFSYDRRTPKLKQKKTAETKTIVAPAAVSK